MFFAQYLVDGKSENATYCHILLPFSRLSHPCRTSFFNFLIRFISVIRAFPHESERYDSICLRLISLLKNHLSNAILFSIRRKQVKGNAAGSCLRKAEPDTARLDKLLPNRQHEEVAERRLWPVDEAQGESSDTQTVEETEDDLQKSDAAEHKTALQHDP